jgi:hypothetical protein
MPQDSSQFPSTKSKSWRCLGTLPSGECWSTFAMARILHRREPYRNLIPWFATRNKTLATPAGLRRAIPRDYPSHPCTLRNSWPGLALRRSSWTRSWTHGHGHHVTHALYPVAHTTFTRPLSLGKGRPDTAIHSPLYRSKGCLSVATSVAPQPAALATDRTTVHPRSVPCCLNASTRARPETERSFYSLASVRIVRARASLFVPSQSKAGRSQLPCRRTP